MSENFSLDSSDLLTKLPSIISYLLTIFAVLFGFLYYRRQQFQQFIVIPLQLTCPLTSPQASYLNHKEA